MFVKPSSLKVPCANKYQKVYSSVDKKSRYAMVSTSAKPTEAHQVNTENDICPKLLKSILKFDNLQNKINK